MAPVIAERSWKNQSRPDLIETNIGMMKILKQISEAGRLFAIEFKEWRSQAP